MGMRRYNRRKLKAHDSGCDRHNKGVSYLAKQERLQVENSAPTKKIRKVRKKWWSPWGPEPPPASAGAWDPTKDSPR